MRRLKSFLPYIAEKKAALFFGAGISSIAGCLGLNEICEQLKNIEIVKAELESKKGANITSRELIAYIRKRLADEQFLHQFEGIMRHGLTPDPIKFINNYIPLIRKIKLLNPLPLILTTNVDPCLANTKEFDMSKIYYRSQDMKIAYLKNGGIFHLHGYYENPENQVWDIFDYENRYNQNFKSFLLKIFKSYSILYLGYAFGDYELLVQMGKANGNNSDIKKHFALLPEDDFPHSINEKCYAELYNIEIIRYGQKKDFRKIFCDWIDSNFNPVIIGKDEEVNQIPTIANGASK